MFPCPPHAGFVFPLEGPTIPLRAPAVGQYVRVINEPKRGRDLLLQLR
jgi:hypothetical protein